MSMPETESQSESGSESESESEPEPGLEPEEHDAGARTAPPDRGRRPGKVLILVAAAALLGLLGWAIAASIGRSDGASSVERADAARIAAWVKASGTQLTALQGDSKALASDVGAPNPATAGAANRLQSAVTAADVQPQVPDTDGNADWETALAEYSSAVQSALAGAGGSDPQALADAAGLLHAGDGQLAALEQRIQALGG